MKKISYIQCIGILASETYVLLLAPSMHHFVSQKFSHMVLIEANRLVWLKLLLHPKWFFLQDIFNIIQNFQWQCLRYFIHYMYHCQLRFFFLGRTISLELKFSLKTVHTRRLSPTSRPDCYQFNVTVSDKIKFTVISFNDKFLCAK